MEGENSIEYVLIIGSMGMIIFALTIVAFVYLFQRKLIKRKIEFQNIKDLLQAQELQSAYAILTAQEKERQRIAKDLHDSVGSMLVTLSMFADSLAKKGLAAEPQNLVEKIQQICAQSNEEIRRIAHNLDSGLLKQFGLQRAIHDLIEAIEKVKTIEIEALVLLHDQLDNDLNLEIYRVIQELINNTLKHAHATKINIELTEFTHEYLSLIYEDNGVGIPKIKGTTSNGIGLNNIKKRITDLNGQVTIDSSKSKGTTIIIEIPLNG